MNAFLFLVNCSVAVGSFVYAISGDTWLHILWGGIAGLNFGTVLLMLKEEME